MDSIAKTRQRMLEYLKKIRELTANDETAYVDIYETGRALGLDDLLTRNLIKHLLLERLVETGLGNGVKITQLGIMAVKKQGEK